METLAYKLTWLSKWKLQCESSLGDPSFTKLIGHYSVYRKTAQYLNDHDDAGSEATAVDFGYTGSDMEDFEWREDAGDVYSFSSGPSDDPLGLSSLHDKNDGAVGTDVSSPSVVISEDEVRLEDDDDDDSDPFSDPEADEFSSGEEEDTSSDSSVEDLEDRDCPPPPAKTVCGFPRPTRPRPRTIRCP